MPPNTTVPIARWLAAPGPDAINSGTTPTMKAIEVITMGRKRRRVASTAASVADIPFMWRSRATHDENCVLLASDHQYESDLRYRSDSAARHQRDQNSYDGHSTTIITAGMSAL